MGLFGALKAIGHCAWCPVFLSLLVESYQSLSIPSIQTADDELDLKIGDVVELVDLDDADWWKGTFHGKTGPQSLPVSANLQAHSSMPAGMFPSNFVELTSAPATGSAPRAAPGPPASAPAAGAEDDTVKAHKVQGVGFGNIFAGGGVTLRKTSGSISHSKRPEPAKAAAPVMPVLKPVSSFSRSG